MMANVLVVEDGSTKMQLVIGIAHLISISVTNAEK